MLKGFDMKAITTAYSLANGLALELHERLAYAECARQAALVHRLKTLGLSKATGQYAVLGNLYLARDHILTPKQIGHMLHVSASDVARLLDALEREGSVQRTRLLEDRRASYVELTEAGQRLAERIVPAVVQFSMDAAQVFSADELQTLNALLARLQAHVEMLDTDRS